MDKNCFVYGHLTTENSVTVGKKGLATLIKASKERGDHKDEYLLHKNTVTVHIPCRKSYTSKHTIATFLKSNTSQEPTSSQQATPTKSKLRTTPSTPLKNKCLFCFERIIAKFLEEQAKLPLCRPVPITKVTSIPMRETVLQITEKRNDPWGKAVRERVINVIDLVAADAMYHRRCYQTFLKGGSLEELGIPNVRGRPSDQSVNDAMEKIYSILDSLDECQFVLRELIDQIDGYKPALKTVKAKLEVKYGQNIIFSKFPGKKTIFFLRDSANQILSDAWYANKERDEVAERIRIVKTAAAIIREDIQSQFYDISVYPAPDRFLDNAEHIVPESLKVLLEEVAKKRIKKKENDVKITVITHAILRVVRPKSFLSSIQIGLGEYIHKKFDSRNLIDLLNHLGLCASYADVYKFEDSCIRASTGKNQISEAFKMFSFDNADFNSNTIDGFHTMHIMGGIMCVTPKDAVQSLPSVPKLPKNLKAKQIVEMAEIEIKNYVPNLNYNRDLEFVAIELKNDTEIPLLSDILWMCGKFLQVDDIGGWNSFMTILTKNLPYQQTQIIHLPFIDLPATNENAILTAIYLAVEETRKGSQETTFVTFDQPLYMKAIQILASLTDPLLSNVVIRVGGFHLLMSFLGCIGSIMNGSGLKEILSTIYALGSIDKILNGHSYARAVRAHHLISTALAFIIWQKTVLTPEERSHVTNYFQHFPDAIPSSYSIINDDMLELIRQKFEKSLRSIDNEGPTASLWVQYFRMVTLMKQFIEAERSGNWKLHLSCVLNMIPYFHAAGHFPYAKSAHIYAQEMLLLEEKMTKDEYQRFTEGAFTVRRSEKYWSGVWSDMAIEQTLMRSMKSQGGLTHGRGVSENMLSRWILGMPIANYVCEALEIFADVYSKTSEQHTDMRPSRIIRDDNDISKLMNWFSKHDPFPNFDKIVSIGTGVVGDDLINCHQAFIIGKRIMDEMTGKKLKEVTMKRSNIVKTFASMTNSIKVWDIKVSIDPLLLFSRMTLAKKSEEELKEFFEYELAPFPLSLFNEDGMRKTTKSTLYKIFDTTQDNIDLKKSYCVIDGGFLLHRVVWPKNATFSQIIENYIKYICKHFSLTATVVFDGYAESKVHTKTVERRRRYQNTCPDIVIEESSEAPFPQDRFLSNHFNKMQFIEILKKKLDDRGFSTEEAVDDADYLIVNTAIKCLYNQEKTVVIVGEDINILVILTALAPENSTIYFYKAGKKFGESKLYASSTSAPHFKKAILFLHAFSSCDSTSAIYQKGKTKLTKMYLEDATFQDIIDKFYNKNAKPEDISEAGNLVFLRLYGASNSESSLNHHRFQCFIKASSKNKLSLQSLPPSEDASSQHSYRVYHQVQQWLGNNIRPEEWGWELRNETLLPITTKKAPAPPSLLQSISCNCSKGCETMSCSCRKLGIKCSVICGKCQGTSCINAKTISLLEDESDEEIVDDVAPMAEEIVDDVTPMAEEIEDDVAPIVEEIADDIPPMIETTVSKRLKFD